METGTSGISSLMLLDDYFEGADYGSGRADDFALETPAALFRLDNSYNISDQYQGLTGAHAEAQLTSITLFLVYHGHFNQCYPLLI